MYPNNKKLRIRKEKFLFTISFFWFTFKNGILKKVPFDLKNLSFFYN